MKLQRIQLCIAALLLSLFTATAQNKKQADIFILSSHTQYSEWAQRMLFPIDELCKERPELKVVTEHLQLLSHPSVDELQHATDSLLSAQTIRPRLVIVLGGSAFNFGPDIQERWPGIPLLFVGEQDYYCDIDYTLNGPGNPMARRTALSVLKNRGDNITLICAPPMIRRTMETMLQVQPKLRKIFFISGENYMCKEQQWRLERYISQLHPDIQYQAISAAKNSTDRMLNIIQRESSSEVAVLYSSWLVREGYLRSVSIRHKTLSLIEALAPVYTIFPTDFEKHPNVVGFYSYSSQEYNIALRQYILDVLDHGIKPSDLPFIHLEAGTPFLNYPAMERFGLDTNLIPTNAQVYGSPKSFWEKYKKQIFLFVLIFIVGLSISLMNGLRRLRKARDIAENANRMKTAFIQNMSHEIRTPLNSIIGFSQLLCLPDGAISPEEKEEYMGHIMNNSHLLTVMIDDILSLSDMEKGLYSVKLEPTDLNTVIKQAIKTVENRICRGVDLSWNSDLESGALYETDGVRVQQILINFLTNACKHTECGSITLACSLTENPGSITFSVTDTGPGVPPEMAEEIFERFVKLNANKQGAGLGLSICRMVATSLGGKVWLDTRYTNGARFVLTIPKKEA